MPTSLKPPYKPGQGFGFFFFLLALESLAFFAWILSIPPDPKNSLLLGLSKERLLLLIAPLIGVIGGFLLAVFGGKIAPAFARFIAPLRESGPWQTTGDILALLVGSIGWLSALLPAYWFGESSEYAIRLQPLLIWFGLVIFEAWVFLNFQRIEQQWSEIRRWAGQSRRLFLISGIFFLVILVLWIMIAISRLGIQPDSMGWYVGGVPLLGVQLFLLWAGLILYAILQSNLRRIKLFLRHPGLAEILLCVALWLSAVILWSLTPMQNSWFAPGPLPPNYTYYPASDAAIHDIGSQYILMGRGVYNGLYTDKPLLMFFLSILHLIAGNNYNLVVYLQILVLAVFPVLMYLLGKAFHSPEAGVFIAAIAILRETNTIAATPYITVSHVKLLMTEFPTAIGMVLFTYFAFKWLQTPHRWLNNLLAACGVLALTSLIRLNTLLVIPVIALLALVTYRRTIRQYLLAMVTFGVVFAIFLSPWVLSARDEAGRPYLLVKFLDVYHVRYETTPTPPPPSTPTSWDVFSPGLVSMASAPYFAPSGSASSISSLSNEVEGPGSFIPAHFVHNLIDSVFSLPNTLLYNNLDQTLASPYFREFNNYEWDGSLTGEQAFFLVVAFIFLALGMGFAWMKWQAAGLVPLAVYLAYNLANAFARVSGGRHLVPSDWVVYFYFGLGIVFVTQCLFGHPEIFSSQPTLAKTNSTSKKITLRNFWSPAAILGLFLLITLQLPLTRLYFPLRYPPQTAQALRSRVDPQAARQALGWSVEQWDAWWQDPNSVILYGLGIYPRIHQKSEQNPWPTPMRDPSALQDNDILLVLLTPEGPHTVLLNKSVLPSSIPDSANWIVMGKAKANEVIRADLMISADSPTSILWAANR